MPGLALYGKNGYFFTKAINAIVSETSFDSFLLTNRKYHFNQEELHIHDKHEFEIPRTTGRANWRKTAF